MAGRKPPRVCQIPRQHRAQRGVPEHLSGTLFCAECCPDHDLIPDTCDLCCGFPTVQPQLCPSSDECPCAQKADAFLLEAFEAWLAERRVR